MTQINDPQTPLLTEPEPLDCVLTTTDIQKYIPHRSPFLFVDRVHQIIPFKSCEGLKMVTNNEWFFNGHFPNHPIMPGVLIIEALAQAAGVLVNFSYHHEQRLQNPHHPADEPKLVYFMSVESAKFRNPVTPGGVLRLCVEKDKQRSTVWRFNGKAYFDDKLATEGQFTAMIMG